MFRYGVVSTASITKRFIDGLRLAGDEVVCIASRDISKAKQFAIENSINRYYGSYDDVYQDEDVDIVYIPVLNSLHYDCAKKALLHKKHVVLEKPFTTSPEQAEELFDIARRNNCFLFEGVKNLFVPSTEFVKKHIPNIGNITSITTKQGLKKPFPKGHWMYDISKGGGSYFGSSSYVFHYLRYLFNSEVNNINGSFVPSSNSDLICNFSFDLGDIKVESAIDMSRDLDNKCIIYGELGEIEIDTFWRSHHVRVLLKDGKIYEFNDEGNEFVYEAKHIQECINKGLIESPAIRAKDSIKEVYDIVFLYKQWGLL